MTDKPERRSLLLPILVSGVAIALIVLVLALLVLRVPSMWAGTVGLASAVVVGATAFPVSGGEAFRWTPR